MYVHKVYEKTYLGEANTTYWVTEEKANTEKKRLIDLEMESMGFSDALSNIRESVEQHYHVDKILVRE